MVQVFRVAWEVGTASVTHRARQTMTHIVMYMCTNYIPALKSPIIFTFLIQ